jgi:hypothetical protein
MNGFQKSATHTPNVDDLCLYSTFGEAAMRKILLLAAIGLMLVSAVSAQSLMDYVSALRGDTLVVKDFTEMGRQPNSLYNVIRLDSVNVPAGRVYMLKANGYYPLLNNPTTRRATTIVGEDKTVLVNNTNANSHPPIICGAMLNGAGWNMGGINIFHDLTVKNCSIIPGDSVGNLGWVFFWVQAPNCRVTLQNDLCERTRWTFVTCYLPGLSLFIKDCYFVNLIGQPCRRSGGVYDSFSFMDTLWVENTTHVNVQGWMYKLRGYPFKRVVFNHNTFIDCSGYVFMDLGYQNFMSTTNNIFVNCNVQAYSGIPYLDEGEHDVDLQPMGLVNVHDLPAGDTTYDRFRSLPRRYLFGNNLVYWDPRLSDIIHILDSMKVNGQEHWGDQKIIMNQRTTSMFNDHGLYPHLKLGTVHATVPSFTNPRNLLTTRIDTLKPFVLSIVDTASIALLPDWRLVNSGPGSFLKPDWPIPVDLSYSDPALLSGGTGGFPLGDLNWFPTQKLSWLAQRDAEYAMIDAEMNYTGVEDFATQPGSYELLQNYPNPFNPTTSIRYSVGVVGGQSSVVSSNVRLAVYDVLGREVAVLVDENKMPGNYEATFDASRLSSGVYFYRLTGSGTSMVKRMLLMK